MSGLFFGNRDIDVKISAAPRFQFGFLNKVVIVTDEDDIPIQKLNGDSAVTELETYLTDNTLTAPKLVQALTVFVGQTDNSGNPIVPEYVYVLGKTEVDVSANVDLLTADIEAASSANDFYGIVPVFESEPFNTWFQTWGASKRRVMSIFTVTQNKELLDTEKSDRILGIYDGQRSGGIEFKNAAWFGRVLSYDEIIAYKWKKLNGVTTDLLGDGDVSSLEDEGWNGYREVRGVGETTGSRTTANTNVSNSFIDTNIVRDNIVYNVAGALHDLFRQQEIVPMGEIGKKMVESAMSTALTFAGSKGLINQFEDSSYQFSIDVPDITAAMRSARELTDVKFTFVPTIPMESIEVTGDEILEWIEG